MKEITDCFKPRYFLARFKFTIQLLVSVLLLSSSAYAQTDDPISILWSGGVGCHVYEAGEPPRDEKEPLFLEDIGDSSCYRVCENSMITYLLDNLPAGSSVDWNVIGGSIYSSNNNQCVVSWGEFGFGSLNFQITTSTTVLTKTICFEKIIGPTAQFAVIPYATEPDDVIPACTDQLIYFTNQSHANNGSALVSYFWDFGDGSYSNAEHPTYAYSQPGSYQIKLTVVNACNCSSTYAMRAEIGPKGFDISCPSIVCEGQRAIYSLPFNGREACGGAYNWSVVGGTIETINQANGDLTVIWDDVDETGFGYVTFDPRDCRLECYYPTTIRVPVIQSKGTIIGPATICVKTFARYELPQWPTTDFQWEIVGNVDSDLADVILTDQRNEVVIFPKIVGTLKLKATYVNTLTGCSGVATFIITSEYLAQIEGDSVFCEGASGVFTTISGDATDWTLFDNNQNVITTLNGSNQFQYLFTTAGNYILSTAGSALCEGEQHTITVEPRPQSVLITAVEGNRVICPTQPYTYSILNADPNSTYHWTIQNGNFIGSSEGESVAVSFNASGPFSLTVIRQSINPIICSSLPTTVPISLQQVAVSVVSENNVSTVCANTYQDFFGYQSGTTTLYTEGETYTWSLSDTSLGSVTQGQGTNAATVLWYNVSTPTEVYVILTIQKCTLPAQVFSYPVTIVPIPIIDINADSSVCSGTTVEFTLSSLNGVVLDPMSVVTWTIGGITEQGGLTHYYTFYNNGNQNIGRTVTAFIESPNSCPVSTNTDTFQLTILPGPPASLSMLSGGNEYCQASEINTVLEIGTSIAGLNVTWYRNGVILSPQPNPITSLTVTPAMGFGSYRFRVVDSSGCVSFSNVVSIIQDCNDIGECTLNPLPELTNTSYNDCGIIYLSGTTTVPSSYESFKIVGPNFNSNNFTGTQFTAAAGEHHIFYQAAYNCTNPPFSLATLQAYEKITVPYVPKFSYEATCNSNTDFTVTFYDETNFFAPVTARQVNYFIRDFGTPASSNVAISGDQIAALPSGTYIVTQVVSGELDLVLQDECSIELEITLTTMSNGIYIENELIFCHDTSVRFQVFGASFSDSFVWTFDEGASSTLRNPQRVFTTSGAHTVYVTVTNNLGCSQPLSLLIDIPEKCFTGDVVVSPNPPTVCNGQGVSLTYVPGVDESASCAVGTYVWMNELVPVSPPVNSASITVTTPGSYWVKLISTDLCEYATPSRISPVFRPLPSLNLTADASVCLGADFTVKATSNASSISWYLNGVEQPQFTNEFVPVFTALPTGTNSIEAIVTLNGCTSSSTLTTVVMPSPTDLVILAPQWISCDPYEYTLTAQTSVTDAHFAWSDGQTGTTITVTAGGPYQVTATIGDCSVSAQIDVPKNPEIYSWIFPSGCYEACKENTGTLIGPRVYLPYWAWIKDTLVAVSNTESFPTPFDLTGSGEYAFTLNTGDCALTTEPLVYNELDCDKCKIDRILPLSIVKNNDIFCSFTVQLAITSGDDFNAVLSAVNDDMVIIPSSFPISTGTFTHLFTIIPTGNFAGGTVSFIIEGLTKDGKPCSYQFTLELPSCEEDNQENRGIAAETITSMQAIEVQLSPNPTQGEVEIAYSGLTGDATLHVYDLTGRLMSDYKLSREQKQLMIQTTSYPAGVYVVVLRQGGSLIGQYKLVKH